MNKFNKYHTNKELIKEVLLDPIRKGADKLIIVSGYVSHNMASWHIKNIEEESLSPIEISLVAGMYLKDGVNIELHEGLKELTNLNDEKYSSFECKYIYKGAPVHSKLYLWLKNNKPFIAFTGSANYTQNGFSKLQREYIVECNPKEAYEYFKNIETDSVICNHNKIEEYINLYDNLNIEQLKQDIKSFSLETVTLSLLKTNGDIGHGSGINWGIRKNGTKREPNQAYIKVPAEIARSGFFPINKKHFSVITDDRKQLILRIEQANNKALTTPLNNSLLGKYLRERIGVPQGKFVTKEDLERYGRTDVTFYKINDEQFFMDFSII